MLQKCDFYVIIIQKEVMTMKRLIMEKLIDWKNNKYRKPLILRGARQVGKTYIIKEFGKENYENIAYFNFDHDEDLYNLFENTKDPHRIIEQLTFIHGEGIKPGRTLIVFDEIQECPNALNSLKYFNEEANEYHVICAGSLLGIRLSNTTFPVGKVDFLNLYPMSFSEFLIADGCQNLVDYMKTIKTIEPIPDIFYNMLMEKLKVYYIIGGMPEVVNLWIKEKDVNLCSKAQDAILKSYESDFSKHTSETEANKVSLIWNNIPSQLAKENKKFLYQVVKEGARAREYEGALNWLNDADLIAKVYNVTKASIPLKAYNDLSAFKIYMLDIGLLRKMSNLESKIIIQGNKLLEEFKGAYSENYVANALRNLYDTVPNYHTFDRNEIDFLVQNGNEIIPIEVKSNKSTNNTSLTKFNKANDNRISIRFSQNNLKQDGKVVNVPLFLIEYINNFI